MKIINKKDKISGNHDRKPYGLYVGVAVVVVLFGLGIYAYAKLHKENEINKAKIIELEENLKNTKNNLSDAEKTIASLNNDLGREQSKNADFQNQIGEITSSVGKLVKLSQTDEELLQKYSKVYFLNENYIPSNLATINEGYLLSKDKSQQIHSNVLLFLVRLMDAANSQGLDLKIASAYRAFGTQFSLKQSYKVSYGAGANTFSADQGYSEHQLGTTVDFSTTKIGSSLTGFEKDSAYNWLLDNAHRYGFVLSYPKNNTFYQFEPWHWRFVGVVLATKLHDEGKNFYDLDQREIDKYLVNIFD